MKRNEVAAGSSRRDDVSTRRQQLATISAELAGIFDRLGSSALSWRARLEKLRTRRLFGRFFAASREGLRAAAARLKVRRVGSLAGCPAP